MQSKSAGTLQGVDISNWQGVINYTKVKQSGIKVVYIKATEGRSYIDPPLKRNYTDAKAAGLYVGFYHFLRPVNTADAIAQAQHFVNAISGMSYDCRLALDLEVTGNLGKDALSGVSDAFMKEVKRLTGKEVVLYTYTSFAQSNLNSSLSIYPLWVAEYGVTTPKSNPIWSSWIGFQYSEKGSVSGISGNCDMDVFTNEILLSASTSAPSTSSPSTGTTTYTVKSGDTLGAIATKFGTTVQHLVQINRLADANKIYVGQVLKIK